MALGRAEQRGEPPKHIRTDRLALERPDGDAQFSALGRGHGEMIGPEGDQPLDEAGTRRELLLQPRLGLGAEQGLLDRQLGLAARDLARDHRTRRRRRRRIRRHRRAAGRHGRQRRHG